MCYYRETADGISEDGAREMDDGTALEDVRLRRELHRLEQEHRDLDSAIDALLRGGMADAMQVRRLKKRKLQLRDRIQAVRDALLPDIIA